jgi:hypothetical protein
MSAVAADSSDPAMLLAVEHLATIYEDPELFELACAWRYDVGVFGFLGFGFFWFLVFFPPFPQSQCS